MASARRRGNSLDGKRWIQNSISVWDDLRKTPEELRLKHPAMFPAALAARLIESFLPDGRHVVLDPFAGTGSTLVAAVHARKQAVGLELSPAFVATAKKRLGDRTLFDAGETAVAAPLLHHASATELLQHVAADSVDLCVTSPPYWNILNQRRTADSKGVRHYGNLLHDLGTIADYGEFLAVLTRIFADVLKVLKAGAHCCVVVMDLRKKNRFYPFHSDLAGRLQEIGFVYDDLLIWNRQAEYNNLRPLGFPSVFRINKVHEFVLLMQKPQ
jgi:DNA modification methylase